MAWIHWNTPIPMPSELMPVFGEAPRAVTVDDKIYFFKYVMGTQELDVVIMDTRDFSCTQVLATGNRIHPEEGLEDPIPFAAVAIQHMVYICGGDGVNPPFGKNVWCFNTQTLQWSHVPCTGQHPVCAKWKALCSVNDKIYMCPHYINYYVYDLDMSMYSLDVKTMAWKREFTNIWPSGYQPDTLVAVGTKVYIMLQNFLTYQHFYLVCFDTVTDTWERLQRGGTIPRTGYIKSAFFHSGHIYMTVCSPDFAFPAQKPMRKYDIQNRKWDKANLQGREVLMFCMTILVGSKIFFFDFYKYKVMYVYDFLPSLRSLSMLVIKQHNLNTKDLPRVLQNDINNLYNM